MTISEKVSKEQFKQALYAVKYLQPAVTALEQIDPWVFSGSLDAMDELTDCLDFLKLNLTEAMRIVSQGIQQYKQRDEELLCAASNRYFKIDGDIALAKSKQVRLIENHRIKVEELTKKQFSPEEIGKIVADPSEEIEAMDTAIESLNAEKLKIQQFLADGPRFDETMLDGTQVFSVLEHQRMMKTTVISR